MAEWRIVNVQVPASRSSVLMGQLSGVYVDDGYSDRSGGVCSAGERPGSDRTAVLAIPSACRSSPSSRTSSGVVTISAYPSRISRCDPLLVAPDRKSAVRGRGRGLDGGRDTALVAA